jgi:COP9 signalosome complex subunit 6
MCKVIAALTAKSNAIKMLKSRLSVISAYIASQMPPSSPPSYLADASVPVDPSAAPSSADLEILRTASALAAQLKLVSPSDFLAFERENLQSKTDVELVTLLSTLTRRANDALILGKKFSMLEGAKRKDRREGMSAGITEQLQSSALS